MPASSSRALLLGAVAVIGLLATGCGSQSSASPASSSVSSTVQATGGATASTTPAVTTTKAATGSACDFTSTPDQPAPQGHNMGTPPAAEGRTGTVLVTVHTSQGTIPISMPRAKAPCTVSSFAFLGAKGYFNNTPCHRLTTADSLKVLQCGDPTGTGTGGPGYTIPDENPTGLPSAPGGQGLSLYARGTVAMANTGQPHTGGSQFFLVYANSELPPSYAVFGQVSAAGLAVLDKIAAGGVQGGNSAQDGKPAIPVTITSVTVAG